MHINSYILVLNTLALIFAIGANNELSHQMASSFSHVNEKCPVINVESPNWASGEDGPLIFNVTVTGVDEGAKLEYE